MPASNIPLTVRVPFFHVPVLFNPDITLRIFFPNIFSRITFIIQDITSGAHLLDSLYRIYKETGIVVYKETRIVVYP